MLKPEEQNPKETAQNSHNYYLSILAATTSKILQACLQNLLLSAFRKILHDCRRKTKPS